MGYAILKVESTVVHIFSYKTVIGLCSRRKSDMFKILIKNCYCNCQKQPHEINTFWNWNPSSYLSPTHPVVWIHYWSPLIRSDGIDQRSRFGKQNLGLKKEGLAVVLHALFCRPDAFQPEDDTRISQINGNGKIIVLHDQCISTACFKQKDVVLNAQDVQLKM